MIDGDFKIIEFAIFAETHVCRTVAINGRHELQLFRIGIYPTFHSGETWIMEGLVEYLKNTIPTISEIEIQPRQSP